MECEGKVGLCCVELEWNVEEKGFIVLKPWRLEMGWEVKGWLLLYFSVRGWYGMLGYYDL